MTRLKILLGGIILVVIAIATIRFGIWTMMAMLIGTILVFFYYNEKYKRSETLTPYEQGIVDESRRRVKKKPWENTD